MNEKPTSETAARPTVEHAITSTFVQTTKSCGVGGPTLTIAYAFGVMFDRAAFPETGLRAWAKTLNEAADKIEGVKSDG